MATPEITRRGFIWTNRHRIELGEGTNGNLYNTRTGRQLVFVSTGHWNEALSSSPKDIPFSEQPQRGYFAFEIDEQPVVSVFRLRLGKRQVLRPHYYGEEPIDEDQITWGLNS